MDSFSAIVDDPKLSVANFAGRLNILDRMFCMTPPCNFITVSTCSSSPFSFWSCKSFLSALIFVKRIRSSVRDNDP